MDCCGPKKVSDRCDRGDDDACTAKLTTRLRNTKRSESDAICCCRRVKTYYGPPKNLPTPMNSKRKKMTMTIPIATRKKMKMMLMMKKKKKKRKRRKMMMISFSSVVDLLFDSVVAAST